MQQDAETLLLEGKLGTRGKRRDANKSCLSLFCNSKHKQNIPSDTANDGRTLRLLCGTKRHACRHGKFKHCMWTVRNVLFASAHVSVTLSRLIIAGNCKTALENQSRPNVSSCRRLTSASCLKKPKRSRVPQGSERTIILLPSNLEPLREVQKLGYNPCFSGLQSNL